MLVSYDTIELYLISRDTAALPPPPPGSTRMSIGSDQLWIQPRPELVPAISRLFLDICYRHYPFAIKFNDTIVLDSWSQPKNQFGERSYSRRRKVS